MQLKNSLVTKFVLLFLIWILISTIPYTIEKNNQLPNSNSTYYENLKTWPNEFLGLNNNQSTGKGVKIAILDTEIKFKRITNLKGEYDFLSNHTNNSTPVESTHADQVVSIISSIAPGAEIYLIEVVDEDGQLKEHDLKNALNWLKKNQVDIVNMSFGFNSVMSTIEPILEQLYEHNTVLVASTGNEGKSRVLYPASSRYTISVGANDFLGQRWFNSNYGNELDFNMPGVKIIDRYKNLYVDGTSFSTAFMSGIIARLKELNPKISNKEIYIKLVEMTNASKWNETNGYGTPTFH
ncbi:hypothetical protein ASG97_12975 [Bacillus sp. Soil745]|uniref:S8 family peptidase n=1 Tax=Peribacillus frigoritolerans TaxID=450367 RepID=UPI00070D1701|nr:S8 family serine peptidase [Peribacillus frigoritolerans]KRF50224.1 hypothetical protein ASG97_12975 [Bacillus sp. Soil745]PAW28921.1 hypothetical protein BKC07_11890 [Peribacillus simplex]ULM96312.1 S8 family serine peptidase [Peribacillus frigoritolerans]